MFSQFQMMKLKEAESVKTQDEKTPKVKLTLGVPIY
jgi:hypothetical protein